MMKWPAWFSGRCGDTSTSEDCAGPSVTSTDLDAIRRESAAVERERIRSIYEAAFIDGHSGLIKSMMFDGQSTVGDVAVAIIQAERHRQAQLDLLAGAELPFHQHRGLH